MEIWILRWIQIEIEVRVAWCLRSVSCIWIWFGTEIEFLYVVGNGEFDAKQIRADMVTKLYKCFTQNGILIGTQCRATNLVAAFVCSSTHEWASDRSITDDVQWCATLLTFSDFFYMSCIILFNFWLRKCTILLFLGATRWKI